MEKESTPIIAGLAVGIAFVVLFSTFSMPISSRAFANVNNHVSSSEDKRTLKLFAIISELPVVEETRKKYGGTIAGSVEYSPEILDQFPKYSHVDAAVKVIIAKSEKLHPDDVSRGVKITVGMDSRDVVVAIFQKCLESDLSDGSNDIGKMSMTISCI